MKCLCKQIAEMAEKCNLSKIQVCTSTSEITGDVDIESTKEADGILVLKNAHIKYECGCEKNLYHECLGVSGLHIVSFSGVE